MMTSLVLSLIRSRKGWILGQVVAEEQVEEQAQRQREQAAGEDDKVENAHKQV